MNEIRPYPREVDPPQKISRLGFLLESLAIVALAALAAYATS